MKRIVTIGSLNLDSVYRVNHFVRPGETLAVTSFQRGPGGKGLNQSIAAARAGASVRHAGKIGPDGTLLRDTLLAEGIDVSCLRQTTVPTGHAIIQVDDNGENAILIFSGANHTLTKLDIEAALEGFQPGELLLCQNEVNAVDSILATARSRGLTVIFNPSPITSNVRHLPLSCVSVLVCNQVEGEMLLGTQDPNTILKTISQTYPGLEIILTLGANGCRGSGPQGSWQLAGIPVRPVDTTAAGDTFVGYLAAGLAAGLPLFESARRANRAAALAVTRPGAANSIPKAEEVELWPA